MKAVRTHEAYVRQMRSGMRAQHFGLFGLVDLHTEGLV